ncbi:hypothetical protein AGABI1DRAFT_73108 [Agaricus bisporus var. burnettii JB137-S8]|uniref:Zona occludens toxin N-terminal domain-containing protein n=1 Tax=Agaricus bisporus var. burnettii (strain JB137-S8 / ATCC MYA-4627 / FGSC 10392) TaxID=597362 RepID=K5WXH1_AGABU|nr:uncharacterized protein AGABI1DRAFT_73108 [Agaricus bisporus var. burnettii JB137-S8]EKM80176.1 hypothetical protein AGABI1DRAFT_73108 [Agaricus bisporus var. burnettii JB137-S8]
MSNQSNDSNMTEWDLLDERASLVDTGDAFPSGPTSTEAKDAPLAMHPTLGVMHEDSNNSQYGLFGQVIAASSKGTFEFPSEARLYMNCSAPFSALLCGVQGAGKSHTLATMLENLLIPNFRPIGTLEEPMCALVLHYGEGGSSSLPSEVAWLASASQNHDIDLPTVKVYVSPSSIRTMRETYQNALGSKVEVHPLYFSESELDAEAILSMMSIDSTESAPLYIQMVLDRLRKLGENFSCRAFQKELDILKKDLTPVQKGSLDQRLALLQSFLEPRGLRMSARPVRFFRGQLTIIDLSDPFIDADSACGIFNIICRFFTRVDIGDNVGKVLVIDEAHKYLSSSKGGSTELTQRILSMIRQQRHLGMRIIISTQEPTILPPIIIDLCNVVILHRFQSPAWWDHIVKHISADLSIGDAFNHVVRLQTGQSIVFAPSSLSYLRVEGCTASDAGMEMEQKAVKLLGRRYLVCQTRKRLTEDGGSSILTLRGIQ